MDHLYNRSSSFLCPGVGREQSVASLAETEPPAYSDLYSRDSSQLDRLVVSVDSLCRYLVCVDTVVTVADL